MVVGTAFSSRGSLVPLLAVTLLEICTGTQVHQHIRVRLRTNEVICRDPSLALAIATS